MIRNGDIIVLAPRQVSSWMGRLSALMHGFTLNGDDDDDDDDDDGRSFTSIDESVRMGI
jgi:hypothetical protein